MSSQSWEKCPVCDGAGLLSPTNITCAVCKGQKIISSLTGKPPNEGVINLTPQKEYPIIPPT